MTSPNASPINRRSAPAADPGISTRDGLQPATAKAGLLWQLARAGLPVPAGVVIGPDEGPAGAAARAAHLPEPLIARSSFDAEDGVEGSAAGRYTSVLHVTHDGLADAIRQVRDSADAQVTRADVLVMAQLPARTAGVAVLEPAHLDDLVEVVDGLADAMVSGVEEGRTVLLPRVDRGLADQLPRVGWCQRLANLIGRVRAELGASPAAGWDLEWVDDGATCWLVQARPLVRPTVRNETLTLANHAEILPDLPSDLMTSVIVEAGPDLLAWYTEIDPRLPTDRDLVVARAGRPLLNQSLLADILRTWGLPTKLLADSMGGVAVEHPASVRRLARSTPALLKLARRQLTAVGDARDRGQELLVLAAAGPRTATGAADAAVAVHAGLVTGMFALANAHAVQVSLLSRLGLLDEVQRRRPTPAGALQRDLTAGLGIDALLRRHGHRGVYESDLARPRHVEAPRLLAQAAEAAVGQRVPAPPKATLAGTAVMPLWLSARRSLAAREDLRDVGMRAFATVRRRLLDDAASLLEDPDDVWLLELDEARRLDDGWRPGRKLLSDRRARRDRRAQVHVPDPVGRTDPLRPPQTGGDGMLTGRTLVAGSARGTAWVCHEPPTAPAPAGGPVILVARAVDGGWVHAFRQADAVVLHLGGDLSHGALILREMGVPTVTGIPDVHRRITDGATVEVQADEGVVLVHAPALASDA